MNPLQQGTELIDTLWNVNVDFSFTDRLYKKN